MFSRTVSFILATCIGYAMLAIACSGPALARTDGAAIPASRVK